MPLAVLRKHNNITSDHLLLARRAIIIPGDYYKGQSLSARPVEGEEEEKRKVILRKWMVACKVAEYVDALPFSLKDFVEDHQTLDVSCRSA